MWPQKPDPKRIPPGQTLTTKFPRLDLGIIPAFDPASFQFALSGAVQQPTRLSWQDLNHLPRIHLTADFHCVTRWSRLENTWTGIPGKVFVDIAKPLPEARFVLAHSADGYTTNLLTEDLLKDNVLLALEWEGQPLTPEHGYPARLIVPYLYGWKSAKWCIGLEFLTTEVLGYWEVRGYHRRGDAFKEERFSADPDGWGLL
jgi:DMSO/TMAO reductase YedYZ molybdopterin-dependent catalytic subunit